MSGAATATDGIEAPDTSAGCPVLDLTTGLSLTDDGGAVIERTRSFLLGVPTGHAVVVTSAMVYGAWDNNPVPLDESRPVRPEPHFALASAMAVAEVMVEQWRSAAPGRSATVLRPAPVIDESDTDPLVRALAHAAGLASGELPAPAQFLHRCDLNSAIELCRERRPDGIFNVAPDGAISGERLRELVAHPLRPSLPPRVRDAIYAMRWTLTRGPIPPGLVGYVRNPWVVSNEALRALGWEPTVSNEEAYVAGTADNWYGSLSARRRQELALVGSVGVVLAIVGVVTVRWRRRRHRADD